MVLDFDHKKGSLNIRCECDRLIFRLGWKFFVFLNLRIGPFTPTLPDVIGEESFCYHATIVYRLFTLECYSWIMECFTITWIVSEWSVIDNVILLLLPSSYGFPSMEMKLKLIEINNKFLQSKFKSSNFG